MSPSSDTQSRSAKRPTRPMQSSSCERVKIVARVAMFVRLYRARRWPNKVGVPLAFQLRMKKPQVPSLRAVLDYTPLTRSLNTRYKKFLTNFQGPGNLSPDRRHYENHRVLGNRDIHLSTGIHSSSVLRHHHLCGRAFHPQAVVV